MLIVDRWNGEWDAVSDAEICGGDIMVSASGYVPKEIQIAQLMSSGQQLDDYYRHNFPGLEYGQPDADYDPTAQMGYDFFDWHRDVQFARNTLDEFTRLQNTDNNLVATDPASMYNKDSGPVTPNYPNLDNQYQIPVPTGVPIPTPPVPTD